MNEYIERFKIQLRNVIETRVGDFVWMMPEEAEVLLRALEAGELDEMANTCEKFRATTEQECENLKQLLKERDGKISNN